MINMAMATPMMIQNHIVTLSLHCFTVSTYSSLKTASALVVAQKKLVIRLPISFFFSGFRFFFFWFRNGFFSFLLFYQRKLFFFIFFYIQPLLSLSPRLCRGMAGVSFEGDVHGLEMALQTEFAMKPLTDILLLVLAEMLFPDGAKDSPLDPSSSSVLTVNGNPVNLDLFIHRCAKKIRCYVQNGRDSIKDSIEKIQMMRDRHRDLNILPSSARESEDEDADEEFSPKKPEILDGLGSAPSQRATLGKLEPSSVLEVMKHFIMLLNIIDEPVIKDQIRGLVNVARTLTDRFPGIGTISSPPEPLSSLGDPSSNCKQTEKRAAPRKRKVASATSPETVEKPAKKAKPNQDSDGLQVLQTPVPLIEKRKESVSAASPKPRSVEMHSGEKRR